jgi:PKD repeat protein
MEGKTMKTINKTAMFLLVLAIFFFTVPTVEATSDPLDGVQIFPSDYIWNVPIDTMPVHPNSTDFIKSENGPDGRVRAGFGYGTTGSTSGPIGGGYALNVVSASNATDRNVIAHYTSPKVPYSFPTSGMSITNSKADGTCDRENYDCSAVTVDTSKHIAYDFAGLDGTVLPNGSVSAWAAGVWPLNDYSLSYANHGSIVAAGSSHLVGMIRYEEIEKGVIPHAIQIAIPYTRYGRGNYTWPAQTDNSIYVKYVSTNYPRMGERYRLNASFDASGYSKTNQIIIQAMKTYGMIVVDNGDTQASRTYELRGFRDSRWNWNDLALLSNIKGSDLEAVDESSLMISKDSGQAKIISSRAVKPTSSIAITSPSGGESWTRNTSHVVTWSYTGTPGSFVKIMLLKSGSEYATIASNTSIGTNGNGSYTWKLSTSGAMGSDLSVRVKSISQPAINDTSDNITILPVVTVLTPSANFTSVATSGTAPLTVAFADMSTNAPTSWTWSFGDGNQTNSTVQNPVHTYLTAGVYDVSLTAKNSAGNTTMAKTGFITIISPPPTDTITVTSPSGGESWTRNTSHVVTWSYTGTPGSFVKVVLLKSGIVAATIRSNVTIGSDGVGSTTWPLSVSGATGSDLKVRVQSINQPLINGTSNTFTITPVTST